MDSYELSPLISAKSSPFPIFTIEVSLKLIAWNNEEFISPSDAIKDGSDQFNPLSQDLNR